MRKKLKVVELFAGVGGFRLGLEGWQGKSPSSNYTQPLETDYDIVWSNQWEPSTKTQHASAIYEKRWPNSIHSNEDIAVVETSKIPDHDLLVGGFPCQDYSVATTLKNAKGLIGKKGVLWWSIHRILSEKERKPAYLLLENVDRLLISPSKQRGRDFAIILKSLADLGYAVEWRVINAGAYGMPQRRKRVFIIGYHQSTDLYHELKTQNANSWLLEKGIMAKSFPAAIAPKSTPTDLALSGSLPAISENFNRQKAKIVFQNTGLMINNRVHSLKTVENYSGVNKNLEDVLQQKAIPEEFYLPKEALKKWQYLKGAKKELRTKADGFEYYYKEGAMTFPDYLDRPSRTIITGEGGPAPSRFKHVIATPKGLRRLTPIELERLNMFPDNHTQLEKITNSKRAFLMGNALVVGVVEKLGKSLEAAITQLSELCHQPE
ncbi:MAG: DNA (cytosine-5-)-methyltransferase [Bacteroidota bacterium]